MGTTWQDRAKRRVQDLGLSYAALGQSLGLTASGVGHYLNGRRHPKPGMLRALAKSLDMSLSELIEDDPQFARNDKEADALNFIRQLQDDQREFAIKMLRELAEQAAAKSAKKSA